jgi:hypothetical protein
VTTSVSRQHGKQNARCPQKPRAFAIFFTASPKISEFSKISDLSDLEAPLRSQKSTAAIGDDFWSVNTVGAEANTLVPVLRAWLSAPT